ncbi:MAG: type II secretion system F family protein [Bacteroidota bacterium]
MMKEIELSQYYLPTDGAEANSKQSEQSIWDKELSFGKKVSLKDKAEFYHMLGILLKSGLGILDALEVLIDQIRNKKLRSILIQIKQELEGGLPLSESFGRYPKIFSPFEIHSIKMAEETGRMHEILSRISLLYEKRIRLRRKISQALSYPISVIGVAILVLGFMIAFVVPMFEDIFSRFDSALPPITEAILSISKAFTTHAGKLVIGVLSLSTSFIYLSKKESFRKYKSSLLLKVPILGKLMLKLQLSRFAYSFALLLSSRVNMDKSLSLLSEIIQFHPIQAALPIIQADIIEGDSLYVALSRHKIFPAFFQQIIKVGEKTARIDEMLENMGQNLEEESEAGIAQLTQFLEPVLIIVLGLMVAVILVAMYLPMFELSNAVAK